ncbi:lytic transglycosylase domain-containing protein [bacterium]|nr:lytic transglycosylase domain-containing protein [bacterium]
MLFALFFMLYTSVDMMAAELIEAEYSVIIEESVKKYPYISADGGKKVMDPALIKAVIYVESRGKVDAKSAAGAYGLTQIMPQTAKLLGCDYKTLNVPRNAVECSVKFLAALLTYNKGDLVKTLSGYNGGTYSTEKRPTEKSGGLAGKIYENPETKRYVVSVLRMFEFFKEIGNAEKCK